MKVARGAEGVGCALSDCLGTDSAGTGPHSLPPPVRSVGTVARPSARIRSSPWPGETGFAGRRTPRRRHPKGAARTARERQRRPAPPQERSCRPGPGPFTQLPTVVRQCRIVRERSTKAPRDERSVTVELWCGKKILNRTAGLRNEMRIIISQHFSILLSTNLSTLLFQKMPWEIS